MLGFMAGEMFRPAQDESERSFREPSDGTLRYSPAGAMPANPFVDEELKAAQAYKTAEFSKLFSQAREGVPSEFATILADDYLIGDQRRCMQSFEGYSEWLAMREPITEEIDQKMSYFERGKATVGEIFDIAVETKIPHFEVGRVTCGYGQRLEFLQPFREEVVQEIENHGGLVFPTIQPYRYRSIDIDPKVWVDEFGNKRLAGFIVKYKRDIGRIDILNDTDAIHVVERQIAGYRIDEASGFDQDIIARMNALITDTGMQWDGQKDHAWDFELSRTGCRDFIETAIQTDSTADFVVPESVAIYGFKESYAPTTQRRLARSAFHRIKDHDGLAYVGPSLS